MVYILQRRSDHHPYIHASAAGLHPEAEWEYRTQGLTVPAHLLPEHVVVTSENPMPDIFEWCLSHFIVSSRARVVFEAFVPGALEYLPIRIVGPAALNLVEAYFYINVLPRDQLIDWSLSTHDRDERRKEKSGRPVIYAHLPGTPGKVIFRNVPDYHIWQEIDVETEAARYTFYRDKVLLSDALWTELERAFAGQIDPRRFPE
jgi:hypothetical protein